MNESKELQDFHMKSKKHYLFLAMHRISHNVPSISPRFNSIFFMNINITRLIDYILESIFSITILPLGRTAATYHP